MPSFNLTDRTEPGFTPGPWELVPQNGAGPIVTHRFETGNQMNPTGLRLIAHMLERGNSLQQDKANARLISAAPDLAAVARAYEQWEADLILCNAAWETRVASKQPS